MNRHLIGMVSTVYHSRVGWWNFCRWTCLLRFCTLLWRTRQSRNRVWCRILHRHLVLHRWCGKRWRRGWPCRKDGWRSGGLRRGRGRGSARGGGLAARRGVPLEAHAHVLWHERRLRQFTQATHCAHRPWEHAHAHQHWEKQLDKVTVNPSLAAAATRDASLRANSRMQILHSTHVPRRLRMQVQCTVELASHRFTLRVSLEIPRAVRRYSRWKGVRRSRWWMEEWWNSR